MVVTASSARCLVCDWSVDGVSADSQAEKHTKSVKHTTVSSTKPVGKASTSI